jgi:hypothetical protein
MFQMVPGLSLRPGSIIYVSFLPTDTEEHTRWKAVIVRPLSFTSPLDCGAFLFRPREGEGFRELPQFSDRHVVNSEMRPDVGDMRKALTELEPIACVVEEQVSKIHLLKDLNTIRFVFEQGQRMGMEQRILLSNDFLSMETFDFFARDINRLGEKAVSAAISLILPELVGEQKGFLLLLRKMRGAMLAVNASGGCGKTRLLKLLVKYAFLLQLADKDHVTPQY